MADNMPMQDVEPSDSRRCQNCGEYVTKQFIRVFGSNDNKVYGCNSCMTGRQIRDGECRKP